MPFLTEPFQGTAGAALSTLPGWSIGFNDGSADLILDGIGGVYPNAQSGFLGYQNSAVPPSANYSSKAIINVGHTGVHTAGVGVRCSANGGYYGWFESGAWTIYRKISTGYLQLDSNNVDQITAGEHEVEIDATDNVITLTVSGVVVITYTDTSPDAITAAGNPGIGALYTSSGSSIYMSTFTAFDPNAAQTIDAPLITSTATIYEPLGIALANTLAMPLISSVPVVYDPSIEVFIPFSVSDAFAGAANTLLENTLNWVRNGGNGAAHLVLNGSGGAYANATDSWVINTYTEQAPPTPDYFVTLDVNVQSTARTMPGSAVRASTGTCYFFNYGAGTWYVYSIVGGTVSQIGSSAVNSGVALHSTKFGAIGGNVYLIVDDTEVVNVPNADISQIGYPGLVSSYANTDSVIDAVSNFAAANYTPPPIQTITEASLLTSTAVIYEPTIAVQATPNTIDPPIINSAAAILSLIISTPSNGTDYYVDPAALDDTGDGSIGNPKKFITSAIALCSTGNGDNVWLNDGTYADALDLISGGSVEAAPGTASFWNKIKAINPGNAIITAGLGINGEAIGSAYWEFHGIKWESYTQKAILSHYIKMFSCAFMGGPLVNNENSFSYGQYQLYEDCWVGGRGGRFSAGGYESQNTILRRFVVRHDGGWGYDPSENPNPEGGLTVYPGPNTTSAQVHLQNVITVDCDTYGPPAMNDWIAFTFNTHQLSRSNVTQRGCISINNKGVGFGLEGTGSWDGPVIDDLISIGNEGGVTTNMGAGTTNTSFFKNCLVSDTSNYAFADWQDTATAGNHFDQSIMMNNSLGSIRDTNMTSRDSNVCFNNGPNGSCGTNPINLDPLANGLLYPVRVESGSLLSTAGPGGSRVGPDVLYKIGVSGTMYGEPGWDTVTNEPLWPWPNEDRIKADFASVQAVPGETLPGARGFATGTSIDGTQQTLTKYIWEFYGNQIPSDIYSTSQAQVLTMPRISTYAQSVAFKSLDQNITAPIIGSAASTYEPLIYDATARAVAMPVINSYAQLRDPSIGIVVSQNITPALLGVSTKVFSPSITAYHPASINSLPVILSSAVIFDPDIFIVADLNTPYVSAHEMVERFGEDELILLSNRHDLSATSVNYSVLSRAINDANGVVDGYISGRYTIPVKQVPPILVRITCDIARYYLYDDAVTDRVQQNYDDAIEFLKNAAKGLVSLGVDADGVKPGTNNEVEINSGGRIMSRKDNGFI